MDAWSIARKSLSVAPAPKNAQKSESDGVFAQTKRQRCAAHRQFALVSVLRSLTGISPAQYAVNNLAHAANMRHIRRKERGEYADIYP